MAVMHFHELDPEVGIFNVSLRMNHTLLASTAYDEVSATLLHGVGKVYFRYVWSGFLTLQHSVALFARETSPLGNSPSWQDLVRDIVIGNLEETEAGAALGDETSPRGVGEVKIPKETFWDIVNGLGRFSSKGLTRVREEVDFFPKDEAVLDALPDTIRKGGGGGGIPPFPRSTGFGDLTLIPFPTLSHDVSKFWDQFGWLTGLIVAASIVLPVSRLIAVIVEEKEIRVKDMVKQMGLRDWVFSLSWIVTYLLIFLFLSLIEMGALYLGTVYRASSFSLVFCFFFLFMCSQIAFCFLASTFFNRAKLAAIVGPVGMLCLLMPAYVFSFYPPNMYADVKQWLCLLAPSAFAFGIDRISLYEEASVGLNWDNYGDGALSMRFVMNMLLLDFFLYGVLAWYLDKVLPSKYGQREAWNFLFKEEFLGRCWKSSAAVAKAQDNGHRAAASWPSDVPSVEIKKLYKVFSATRKGNKVAIAGLNLEMNHNEITCLLGTNGAGKTTTISILTGTTNPSGGECTVYGSCIRTQMHAVRRILGICPQYDVLFKDLTVREHLEFYAVIKGVAYSDLDKTVAHMIAEVELCDKEHFASSSLSGGQKRKLSVAMALVGGSKVVFLDEPTSGMDPQARRSTWELLMRARQGRTSILTTHYLDEADLLGDRIAIMKDGRLCAFGSSLELKNRFGLGYILTLVIDTTRAQWETITRLIYEHVSEARPLSSSGSEMSFQLPFQCVRLFPRLFEELEAHDHALGINSYGISMTTLEEVFLTIAGGVELPPKHAAAAVAVAGCVCVG
jgi:ATP-binding cassette subfamily A (ABC1) protein 3